MLNTDWIETQTKRSFFCYSEFSKKECREHVEAVEGDAEINYARNLI